MHVHIASNQCHECKDTDELQSCCHTVETHWVYHFSQKLERLQVERLFAENRDFYFVLSISLLWCNWEELINLLKLAGFDQIWAKNQQMWACKSSHDHIFYFIWRGHEVRQ